MWASEYSEGEQDSRPSGQTSNFHPNLSPEEDPPQRGNIPPSSNQKSPEQVRGPQKSRSRQAGRVWGDVPRAVKQGYDDSPGGHSTTNLRVPVCHWQGKRSWEGPGGGIR